MSNTRVADDLLFNRLNAVEERLRKLEKHEHPTPSTGSGVRSAIFHMEGALVLDESDPDVSATTRRYTKVVAGLGVVGGSMTTVIVRVDGDDTGYAVSLATGETAAVAEVQVLVPALVPLTVETTVIGSSAEGLTVAFE